MLNNPLINKSIYFIKLLDYILYRFFTFWGETIIRMPNKFFYAVLVIAAVFFPLFAGFLVLSLLCYAYRKHIKDTNNYSMHFGIK